jgi:hypothetical protein
LAKTTKNINNAIKAIISFIIIKVTQIEKEPSAILNSIYFFFNKKEAQLNNNR